MPRITAAKVAAPSTKSLSPHDAAFQKLNATLAKLDPKRLPKATLTRVDADLFSSKGGGKLLSFWPPASKGYQPIGQAMVDEKKKIFYVDHKLAGVVGPFELPRGVTLKALLDDGKAIPRGRTVAEKALGAMAGVIQAHLPEALLAGRKQLAYSGKSFLSPTKEKLEHAYIKDSTGKIPGGALMIGKSQVWVEQIPGVSGQVIGPFPLPKGYTAATLAKALGVELTLPAPKPKDGFEDGAHHVGHRVTGSGQVSSGGWSSGGSGGSGSWQVTPGGNPS